MNFLSSFFDTQQFAPHGQCLLWQPDLLILYTVSDAAIALAYFSIPLALAWFVIKRRDIAFRWVFVLFCIFIVIINTAAGLREVPDEVMEMARAFEVRPRAMLARILIPWAGPYILTGIRMSVGRSIQGALIADLFLRAEGLGLYMIKAGSSFELDHLYAAVLVLTVLGALVMSMAKAGENRLLAWKTA